MALPQTSNSAGSPEARHRLCATGPCHEGRRISTAAGRGPSSRGGRASEASETSEPGTGRVDSTRRTSSSKRQNMQNMQTAVKSFETLDIIEALKHKRAQMESTRAFAASHFFATLASQSFLWHVLKQMCYLHCSMWYWSHLVYHLRLIKHDPKSQVAFCDLLLESRDIFDH